MEQLKICHLYPDTLNLYGDRGNIICMKKRLEWRRIDCEIDEIPVGTALDPSKYDVFFIGGGQDFEQSILLNDLKNGKGDAIKSAVEDEKVFLAICGGYQLLGQYYKTWDGKQLDFLGAINVHTIGEKKRLIGDFKFTLDEVDGGHEIVGFENHSGLTFLGDGVRPLGTITAGFGNNGKDKTEGARYKNVFASYSHGPLLPKNPELCDLILKTAFMRKNSGISLSDLDDRFESSAREYMKRRLQK